MKRFQVSGFFQSGPVPAALTTFSRAASLRTRGSSTHRRLGSNMYPRDTATQGGCALQSGDRGTPRDPTHTMGRYGGPRARCVGVCVALVVMPTRPASAAPIACVPVLTPSAVSRLPCVPPRLVINLPGPICASLARLSLFSHRGRGIPHPATRTCLLQCGAP